MITISIDPVAFTLGPFTLRWYGVMVVLAIVLIVLWAARAASKVGLSRDTVYTAAIWAIPGGYIGSRLVHIIDQLDYYLLYPRALLGLEGQTIFGAVLGGALAVWIYSRIGKFSFGKLADLIAPGAILGQAVGRVGCTINGCCYGSETSLPWGFVYTHPDSYAPLSVAVHPAPVYEILWDLMVFGVLWNLRGRLRPDGMLFLLYLALYSVGKFLISFLRTGTTFFGPLQQAHIIALLVLLAVVPAFIYRVRWVKPEPAAASDPTLGE